MSSHDVLDVSLDDADLRDELRLLAELMVAANQSPGPLASFRVDRLLGLPSPGCCCR